MTTDDRVLRAVEDRLRTLVNTRLATAGTAYANYVVSIVSSNPDATVDEIVSRPDVHRVLTTALSTAETTVGPSIRAGYRAAAAAAVASAAVQLEQLGVQPPTTAPSGDYLDAVMVTVAAAFTLAAMDIVDSVRAAGAGVTAGKLRGAAARAALIPVAVRRATRRLGVRVNAAAAVAVHRGYSDAQLSIYRALHSSHPGLTVHKRWYTTSDNPCPVCAALNGTQVPVDAEFDHAATNDPRRTPPNVYRNLLGPPRHPNCRCRIEFEPSEATVELRQRVIRTPPAGTPIYLSAAAVRQMPTVRYEVLLRFLRATLRRVRSLLRRINSGG